MTKKTIAALAAGLALTACTSNPAAAEPTPEPAALIYATARAESGCNVATFAFGTEPENATVTVWRSLDGGPWEPQDSDDRVRFEHHPGVETVQWAVQTGTDRRETDTVELHQCTDDGDQDDATLTPTPTPAGTATPTPAASPDASTTPTPAPGTYEREGGLAYTGARSATAWQMAGIGTAALALLATLSTALTVRTRKDQQ